MDDDAHGPFFCPDQECQKHQVAPVLGDAKRFYLHWLSTHKPKCPRTDCRYSLQGLSKTTESYFLRHWSSHFPNLNTGKSACGKCGREFANSNNRDRHSSRCQNSTSTADFSSAESIGNGSEHGPASNQDSTIALNVDPHAQSENVTSQDTFRFDSLSWDAELVAPSGFITPSVWQAEALDKPAVSFSGQYAQLASSTVERGPDCNNLEQMVTPSMSLCPSHDIARSRHARELSQATNDLYTGSLTNHGSDVNLPWSMAILDAVPARSRKRACENTTPHTAKRHQTSVDDIRNINASFTPQAFAENSEVVFSGASECANLYRSNGCPRPMIQGSPLPTTGDDTTTDGDGALWKHLTFAATPPLKPIRQHTQLETTCYSKTLPGSRRINVHSQVVAIKSYIPSENHLRVTTHDRHTLIRKLVFKPRKIKETTSLLVNNILMSKKTRFSRVRTVPIYRQLFIN
jgi:hypothetical protein